MMTGLLGSRRAVSAIVVFAFVVSVVVYLRLTRQQLSANRQPRPQQRPPGIIVITGGMGNIGRALTRQLVAEGWRVRVLDLPYMRYSEPLLHLPEAFSPPPMPSTSTNSEGFQYFEGDVRNVTDLRKVLLTSSDDVIAGVVHLGGFTQATKCELSPQLCSDVNLGGTRNILNILQETSFASPWILYASSYEVSSYETSRSRASAFASITWKVEQLLKQRCTGNGVSHMIMRLSSVYGEFEGETRTRLIPHLVLDALRDIQVFVSGPNRELDFVHMSDVISAMMKGISVLESAATEGKIRCEGERELEIGSGEATSTKQLVKTIFTSLIPTSLSRVVLLPALNPSVNYHRANVGKAKSVLNWEPKVTLVQGLKKYIEDIQQRTIAALQHRAFVFCPSPFREKPTKEEREGWSVSRLAHWRESIKARVSSLKRTRCKEPFNTPEDFSDYLSYKAPPKICRNSAILTGEVQISFCDKLEQAISFARSGFVHNISHTKETCGPDATSLDLPICEYDCGLPTICLLTGRCRCLNYHRCILERRLYPLSELIKEHNSSFPPTGLSNFHDNTVAPSLKSLLPFLMTPFGRAVTSPQNLFLRPTILEPPRPDNCGWRAENEGFAASKRFAESLQAIKVPDASQAEMFYVLYYHICDDQHPAKHQEWVDNRTAIAESPFTPKVWSAMHDRGACFHFSWTVDELRRNDRDTIIPMWARPDHYVLQANGDADTNCYDPLRTIVVPPYLPESQAILNSRPENSLPMAQRGLQVFFAGTAWLGRNTYTCQQQYRYPATTLISENRVANYTNYLLNSRFCLSPPGTAGWSFRFFSAIGHGCVPVWPTAHSIPPFASFLDYTYFTFFMRPIDIKILEQLLYSVPISELDEMQLALKIVRQALIYNVSSPDLNRWSPTDLGLRQLYTLVRSQDKSTL